MSMRITAKMFKHATGYEPVNDDLERAVSEIENIARSELA